MCPKATDVCPSGRPGGRLERLKAERVQLALAGMPGWELDEGGETITRAFGFRSSPPALQLVGMIGALAEEAGHYPAVTIERNTVVCRLTTPDVGGVTEMDLGLAKRIGLTGE